jgi:hypothetical protein
MRNSIFPLAAMIGLAMTVVGAQGATIRENAMCGISEDAVVVAVNSFDEGDQKALQILVDQGKVFNLNGIEVTQTGGELDDYGIVAVRVTGTLDVYYVCAGNVIEPARPDAQAAQDKARAMQHIKPCSNQLLNERDPKSRRSRATALQNSRSSKRTKESERSGTFECGESGAMFWW